MNAEREALDRADAVVATMARLLAQVAPRPEMIGGATPVSHLAGLVARAAYLPRVTVLASQGRAGGSRIGWLGQEDAALVGAGGSGRMALDLPLIFTWVTSGRFAIWISPAQIDRFGNTNISRIGPADRPRPALVGSRGLPDDSVSLPNGLYYVPAHGLRSIVEQVDFVSGVGDRRRLPEGSRAPGRPAHLVTDLGVFDFGGTDGAMRLRALLPGASLEAVVERTPFDVLAGSDPRAIAYVAPPTDPERAALERFDPLGVRALEFCRDAETAAGMRERIRAAEEADLAPRLDAFLAGVGLAGEGR